MIHPDTELRFISSEIGYGVVATKLIVKGTITWALDRLDQVLSPKQVEALPPLLQDAVAKYSYFDKRGRILCWDIERFINHHCEPSCAVADTFTIAVRNIYPGEQLTQDYGSFFEATFECACQSNLCRGRVSPYAPQVVNAQIAKVKDAFALAYVVPQPLWQLVCSNVE